MAIWINGKEVVDGATVIGSDYIAAGAGTPNVIDQSGGDIYITDDLEVDGTTTLDGALLAKSTVTIDGASGISSQDYVSIEHDDDDAVFQAGHGGYVFGVPAQSARGTVTFAGIPSADETIVVNATTITFKVDGSGDVDHCTIGGDAAECVTNLVTTLGECSESGNLSAWDGTGDTVVIEWGTAGVAGNSIVFSGTPTNVSLDGSGFFGGTHAGVDAATLLSVPETGPVKVGSGTPGNATTDESLYVSDRLEADGTSYLKNCYMANCYAEGSLLVGSVAYANFRPSVNDGVILGLGSSGYGNNNFIITSQGNRLKDHNHVSMSANPTLYGHSEVDPTSDDTQWWSITHDQTNGVIQTGKGNLTIGSGSTSHSLNSNGSVFFDGSIEADGVVYIDASPEVSAQDYLSVQHDGDDAAFSSGHGGYTFGVPAQSARGTITFSGVPVADETIVVNATTITFKADGSGDVDHCTIGGDASECVTNLVTTLGECSESGNLSAWDGTGDTVVIEWGTAGTAGNSIVLTEAATNVTVDGSGTLGGTHAGVAADTLLTLKEDAVSTFGGVVRADSSVWWHVKEIAMYAIDPGASGATATVPTANTLGGYQLDADSEYLYFQGEMESNWDAASDPVLTVTFECNVDNSGGNAGDTIDFDLVAYMKGVTDTATKSQSLSGSVTVGACARYTMFSVDIAIDYDDGSNPVSAGDILNFRLNLDTTDSDVDNVVVNHLDFKYRTAKVNPEV